MELSSYHYTARSELLATMNSNMSTVLVTITDYVTIYPTLDSVLTSGKSSIMVTQPTSAAISSGSTSSVKNLESFPIVAQPTLVRTTGRTSATSFRSTLQTSVRSSVSSRETPSSISSSSLSVTSVIQTSSQSTFSLVNSLPTGWPKPSAAPQSSPERHSIGTVTILLISLFVALSGLLFLVTLYLLRKGTLDDWRRKITGILRLKKMRLTSREDDQTRQDWQETPTDMKNRSPEAGHVTLEQVFLQPGEEVTLPQAVYSRGIRIVAQPRPSQSLYQQEPDPEEHHRNHVDRVFNVVTTDVPSKTECVPSWRMSTHRSTSTASIVSTATIESMESLGPTVSAASSTSKRLRNLTVEQNRSQALSDLTQWEENISVKQNRSEAPFDLTQWDDGFEEVRQTFWERSLAVVELPNYGRPPGVKRDKYTNFAGKSKLQVPLSTTGDTGATTAAGIRPLRVRNGRDESLHPQHGDVSSSDAHVPPRANTDGEFITVALDSPILGMSDEEMEQARLAKERRCMEKRRTDGYGRFEQLKSVLPDGMDGRGLQNPYRW